jgi:hypothetical protein
MQLGVPVIPFSKSLEWGELPEEEDDNPKPNYALTDAMVGDRI